MIKLIYNQLTEKWEHLQILVQNSSNKEMFFQNQKDLLFNLQLIKWILISQKTPHITNVIKNKYSLILILLK